MLCGTLDEMGAVFDVDMDALGEDSSKSVIPGFGDVTMVDCVSTLVVRKGEISVRAGFMEVSEPGDITDDS